MVAPVRFYAVPSISKAQIESRALEALKKVAMLENATVTVDSSFAQDLGLDSLSTVEALVALEDEFDMEIPDKIADDIKTVREAVEYIYEEELKFSD